MRTLLPVRLECRRNRDGMVVYGKGGLGNERHKGNAVSRHILAAVHCLVMRRRAGHRATTFHGFLYTRDLKAIERIRNGGSREHDRKQCLHEHVLVLYAQTETQVKSVSTGAARFRARMAVGRRMEDGRLNMRRD